MVPGAVAALIGVAVLTAALWWRRRRTWRRARAAARWVELEPPSHTETAHAQEMWRQLTGLLRPGALGARTRLLAWELHAGAQQVRAGLWVPGTVGAEDVAEALAASYRRSAVRVRAAADTGGSPVPRAASAGYVVVPRTSMWQPLTTSTPSSSGRPSLRGSSAASVGDPLDGLWRALAGTPHGYRMTVQVLARPMTRGTRAQACRTRRFVGDRGDRRTQPLPELLLSGLANVVTGVLVGFLDALLPGPPARTATSRSRTHVPALDPITQQERRTAAAKASAELVEICVRIVAVGPDRVRCRQLAWRAANALRGVVTAQATDTVRLPDAGRRAHLRMTGNGASIGLRGRRPGHLRGWFAVTDAEVGALARVPHQPAWFRFTLAGAPHLPAPLGLPRLGTPGAHADGDYDGEVA